MTVRDATTARRDDRAAVGWAWTGRNLTLDEALRTGDVFRIPRNFSNSDLITVNIMWVLTSFVIKVFFRLSRSLTDTGLALVARYANLYHRDRVRCGRHRA